MEFQKHKHYSLEIERAILGICLLEKEAFGKIYSDLNKEHFYSNAHQHLFSTIRDMYINGIPIDILTVTDHVMRVQGFKTINQESPDYFIAKLTNDVVSSIHIEYHSFIIRSMWMERELMKLTNGGASKEGDVKEQIQNLQEQLQLLQIKTTKEDWADMSQLMVELYQHQEEIKLTGGIGISCGIRDLDVSNGGFHPGQMIVIGARPSVGKSALAGSIGLHMAQQNKTVGIISLEMNNTEIAARLAALDTDTDFSILYRGLYKDEQQTKAVYSKIASSTQKLPIYVSDKTEASVIDIKSKAQKLKSLHGLDCLIIDYLQLIDVPEQYNRTRENEISKISRHCKILAKELNIPVLLLCQLNREVTKRTGEQRYPQLSDLRESGSIEQDADVVMFLHRDWMNGITTDEQGGSTEFAADLVVRKWRNGKSNFIIKLTFNPGQMKFYVDNQPAFSGFVPNTQYFD